MSELTDTALDAVALTWADDVFDVPAEALVFADDATTSPPGPIRALGGRFRDWWVSSATDRGHHHHPPSGSSEPPQSRPPSDTDDTAYWEHEWPEPASVGQTSDVAAAIESFVGSAIEKALDDWQVEPNTIDVSLPTIVADAPTVAETDTAWLPPHRPAAPTTPPTTTPLRALDLPPLSLDTPLPLPSVHLPTATGPTLGHEDEDLAARLTAEIEAAIGGVLGTAALPPIDTPVAPPSDVVPVPADTSVDAATRELTDAAPAAHEAPADAPTAAVAEWRARRTSAPAWAQPTLDKEAAETMVKIKPPRVPYFDRPQEPRDWRFAVAATGRTLITLGLLLFGFVGYQLWGTGLQTARAQAALERELEDAFDTTTVATTVPPTSSTVTDGTAPGSTVPETTEAPTDTVAAAPLLANGDPVGRIVIPKIDLDWVFVEGVRIADLKKGPGHFRETPMPGELGNATIAGHRTTYGEPFRNLDQLIVGDLIQTILPGKGKFVYEVTETFVVYPDEYDRVVPTKDPEVATLTLVTCTPVYSSSQRLIIRGQLVPGLSDRVGERPQPQLPDVVVTVPSGESGELPDDTSSDEDVADADADVDSFFVGWFEDTAAVPHVLAWGALLAAVGVGAYLFGRSRRSLVMTFVAGTVPFLVVLYFFYENVNRLLPSGL